MSRSSYSISNGNLLISNPSQLQDLNVFTYSFWIKREDNLDTDNYVLSLGSTKRVFVDSLNRLHVEISHAVTNATLITSSNAIPENEWVNVCVVFDSAATEEIIVYIADRNGSWAQVGTLTAGVGVLTADGAVDLYLLNRPALDKPFNGSLAEVGIWNRALTTVEIENLAVERYTPSLVAPGLIGCWRLLGHDPEVDSSSSGNNAIPSFGLLITDGVPLILTHVPVVPSEIILYAPNLKEPIGGEVYNKGVVSFEWDIKDPPSNDSDLTLDDVTYELEFTEKYIGRESVWHAIRKRIAGSDTSYDWTVGKMLKGENLRFRIRSFCVDPSTFSEYSSSATDCSVNVFKVVNPVILSPIANKKYSNNISIILEEAELINTYNQKIRYKVEYQSEDADVAWTVLYEDLPVGSSPLLWNVDELGAANDYQLKLTVYDNKNNQITVAYVRDISITHPGLFYIDTKPPTGVVQFETNSVVSNSLDQTVNLYVDDAITAVKSMFLRSKNLTGSSTEGILLTLGPTSTPTVMFDPLQIEENCEDFTTELGYIPKVQWKFPEESGLMKLEANLKDYGGNTSCQDKAHLFMKLWSSDENLTDIISFRESREYLKITDGTAGTEDKYINVAYVSTDLGKLYKLEPYPVLVYTFSSKISKIYRYLESIYVFIYNSGTDISKVYRDDKVDDATLLTEFTDSLCEIKAVAEFSSCMYFGMQNGQLWRFDGSSFSKIHTFTKPISSLLGDSRFLYIGFIGSSEMYVYDLFTFTSFDTEV